MGERRPPALVFLCVAAAAVLGLLHAGELRDRASAALGRGMPAREAELARGFVLGEDQRIDPATVEDFRRAGLGHLLAVSGQNVALLVLLAMPVLALLGMPLTARLAWLLGLIALYVPLAGAGPSIQRAGVMGALAVLATLAGRRTFSLYALALAAIVTLALDPGIAADVGWQLSFAAVLGILLLASQLRKEILAAWGAEGPLTRTVADGAAMTMAATLTTAPLVAFHFGELSTMSLLANLLVLPAVAPAMWLGMVAMAAGQLPGLPIELVNLLAAPLLAYVAQIARWCAAPSWASVRVELGPAGLLACYLALAALGTSLPPRLRTVIVVLAVAVPAALALTAGGGSGTPPGGLRVSVLDVGQGDAILLQPANAPAVLVDGGPPGGDLARELREAGVEGLGAAMVTHDQSDHAGGIEELLGRVPVGRLLYAVAGRTLLARARAEGVSAQRLTRGAELRAGGLRLEAIWPPPELAFAPLAAADANRRSLVLLARWRDFSMLLAADAEAESTPLDPGPVDVLKVAHHGSEDAGLDRLLDGARPSLAVVSAGEGNPYGHPSPVTLATLAARGIPTLRTDTDGEIVFDVRPGTIEVRTAAEAG